METTIVGYIRVILGRPQMQSVAAALGFMVLV